MRTIVTETEGDTRRVRRDRGRANLYSALTGTAFSQKPKPYARVCLVQQLLQIESFHERRYDSACTTFRRSPTNDGRALFKRGLRQATAVRGMRGIEGNADC